MAELTASNLVLTIDGVDRTAMLVAGSLGIDDGLGSPASCDFELDDQALELDLEPGDVVIVTDGVDRHFGGSIAEPSATPYRGGTQGARWRVKCDGFEEVASRHLVARIYENTLAGDIVRDIVDVDLAGEGITTVDVEDGPLIERAVFNYQPASRCFDDLAELTGYSWRIDYSKGLHFAARESDAAPISFTDSSGNFRSVAVAKPRGQYRNRQLVRAGTDITDTRVETFAGDATRRTFSLAFPVATEPKVRTPGVARELLSAWARQNEAHLVWTPGDANTLVAIDPAGLADAGVSVTRVAAGSISARPLGDECPGVVVGQAYTFTVSVRPSSGPGRTVHVELEWLDALDVATGARAVGANLAENPAGWVAPTVVGAVAPAGAVKVRPYLVVAAPAAAEFHVLDAATLTGDGYPTVGIKALDPAGSHAWYWQKGSPEVTQDDLEAAVTGAQTAQVTYRGTFPLLVVAEDADEIARRAAAEGGSGIYEAIEDNQQIETAATAAERANALLRRFGTIPHVVTIDTDDGWRLAPGMLLPISVASAGVDGTFLVESVTGRSSSGKHLVYGIKALSGESLGGWVDFFARLAREGRPFTIRENEVVLMLRRVADALILADTLDAPPVAYVDAELDTADVSFSEVAA